MKRSASAFLAIGLAICFTAPRAKAQIIPDDANPKLSTAGEILMEMAGDLFLGQRDVRDVVSFTCGNGKLQAVCKTASPSGTVCSVFLKGMPGVATFQNGAPHKALPQPEKYLQFHYFDPSQPGAQLVRTEIGSFPDHLDVSQFTELQGDLSCSVQLVQSSAEGPQVVNLYIQDGRDGLQAPIRKLKGASITELAEKHPEEIDRYVRPIFRTLGQEENVFITDPRAAYQVLADLWQPDAKIAASADAAVAGMAADAFADRETALTKLHDLGEPAALYLMRKSHNDLSVEQRMRVDLFLGSYLPLTDEDAQTLGKQTDFLLDSLYNSDSVLRSLVLKRIEQIAGKPVDFDVNLSGDALRNAVLKLRLQLSPDLSITTRP